MGQKKQEKSKRNPEIRGNIDPVLFDLFQQEAAKERRKQGAHLNKILEERYKPESGSATRQERQ